MQRISLWFLLASVPLLMGCGASIPPGKLGLASNAFGKPGLQEEIKEEGFYFQWPWNGMIVYDVTWQTRTEDVEVLTADDLHVPTKVSVMYRPVSQKLHQLHTEIGPEYYADVIRPEFMTLARSEFARYLHKDLARQSPAIETAVQSKLRQELAAMPFEIGTVTVEHIMFDREVTRSISTKLVMEQQAEQKAYEIKIAQQEAEIARVTAQGRGDALRIEAEGEARAIVLKASAQSEAQEVITKTLSKHYLQYKAFDGTATTYYFVPVGKDGLPLLVNTP